MALRVRLGGDPTCGTDRAGGRRRRGALVNGRPRCHRACRRHRHWRRAIQASSYSCGVQGRLQYVSMRSGSSNTTRHATRGGVGAGAALILPGLRHEVVEFSVLNLTIQHLINRIVRGVPAASSSVPAGGRRLEVLLPTGVDTWREL